MNMLKFSFIWRCASVATVSKTIDDLPEPETPVKIVILRLGMRSETFLRLFSRAPRISIYSWGMKRSLSALMYFRSTTFALQFGLIEINGGADKILKSAFVNLIALEKVDRPPHFASKAVVEELIGIRQAGTLGKRKLHLIFVSVADRDDSVARPYRASHPLPFLDDLPVGLQDGLADAGQRFGTPVGKSCDQLVNTFRWIHCISRP